jgi:phosphoribosylanthranilate isomerase
MAPQFAKTNAGTVAAKICGIALPELALSAAESGANMVGMVFAPSRRQVSPETAKHIRRALAEREHATGERPLVVGVFVNEPPHRVVRVAREVGLDIVQLSGDESAEDAARCAEHYPVIKAFRFASGQSPDSALKTIGEYASLGHRVRPLLDAHTPGAYGGTGHLADWSLAAVVAAHYPVILAGGLMPGNVAQAIEDVRPWGVDVSSGVERDQRKDPQLMMAFARVVRAASRGKVEIAL